MLANGRDCRLRGIHDRGGPTAGAGHVSFPPIATDFSRAAKFRNVPQGDIAPQTCYDSSHSLKLFDC
jgi:hypothetical protein